MDISQEDTDRTMMARCIELSRTAVDKGENPFGSVIALDGVIVAEAMNRTVRDADLSRHAEILALAQAQKSLGLDQLYRCTLYSSVEPCAMCSYCIRESGIGRVVYALGSPVMGGVSKWKILHDDEISDRIPQVFGPAPEIVSGVLLHEAQAVWRSWNPFAWQMIKMRGLLIDPAAQHDKIELRPAGLRSAWHRLRTALAWAAGKRTKPEPRDLNL